MAHTDMPLAELLKHLEKLAQRSLALWDMPPNASAELINVSENATYLVEAEGGYKAILRIHREQYHSRRAIECELAWIAALKEARAVVTPDSYTGKDGEVIQEGRIEGLENPRYMVLFEFVEGTQPDEAGDLEAPFEELGEIAARTHEHSKVWQRPPNFERLIWNVETIFGRQTNWGDWRDAPNVTPEVGRVLGRVEGHVRTRLESFGASEDRYGLIHADMRLANLLVGPHGTRLIDFDDCGYGWFLYDFATGISFMEDDPRVPALKDAWVRGYEKVRQLTASEKAEIDTFVMLRRMALLAWIGSHIEAPEPQAMAPDFARVTAELGQAWLDRIDAT
ncbi:phosphotransferase enzyme family protein [Roseovarius sp. D0-M9]|uniref:phosphotransferase enzyme family protein n=1 Tax=Roseovarius sp. D0-M9 TaxID=3127117 RepID=UPI0030100175